jgi:NADH:ubiquinone oxidoreductase subunit 6 (subunit J)
MMLSDVAFYIVGLVLLASAFRVVTSENLVHTVLWLGVTLATTAVLFVFLGAAFMAAVQLILYTGGVLTLMLFGVMLTNRDSGFVMVKNPAARRLVGSVIALGVFGMLTVAILRTPGLPNSEAKVIGAQTIGASVLTEHVLAFEILSLLLLAATLGAIVLARRNDAGDERELKGPLIPERRNLKKPMHAPVDGGLV